MSGESKVQVNHIDNIDKNADIHIHTEIEFTREKHIQYFVNCLKTLPPPYCKLDTNRLTLVHFAVQSLDMLHFFNDDEENRHLVDRYQINTQHIIDWTYALQTKRVDEGNGNGNGKVQHCGFKGGTFLGCKLKLKKEDDSDSGENEKGLIHFGDHGHLAMTYTALCTLITLGDDLSRVDRKGIINSMKVLQSSNGSFQSVPLGSEEDMRFLYCACCISYMLNDWSGIDVNAAVTYIQSCRSYDGAISLLPGQEGHGGSTFCAIASLFLLGRLDEVLDDDVDDDGNVGGNVNVTSWRQELIQWCVSRQIDGLQGRPNKLEDTCYSYWIGGTLRILKCDDLLDKAALKHFILCCQTDMGGFSKLKSTSYYPDLLHSFYSMAWLSLSEFTSDSVADGDGTGTGTETVNDGNDKDDDSKNPPSSATSSNQKQNFSTDKISLSPLDCVLGMSRRRLVEARIHTGTRSMLKLD